MQTAALSTALFKSGMACGACYEVKCTGSPACLPGSVLVTATNFCPPNYALSASNGGWCNPPNEHFDLSEPSFSKIAKRTTGVVPIEYRRYCVVIAPKSFLQLLLNAHHPSCRVVSFGKTIPELLPPILMSAVLSKHTLFGSNTSCL